MSLMFDDRMLLTPGVHEASMKEVEQHFARFQKSDRRIRLFRRLSDYVAALKKAKCATSVILNGSFVMACIDEPDDVDLILIFPPGWDDAADLKPYQYNLVSKRRVRKEYGLDIFPVMTGSAREQDWTAFFTVINVKWCRQFGWPNETTKGLVRVTI